MRKHLSVLGLAARGAVGRILLITVLTAALAGALLYLVLSHILHGEADSSHLILPATTVICHPAPAPRWCVPWDWRV